jgi:hypothetical protein
MPSRSTSLQAAAELLNRAAAARAWAAFTYPRSSACSHLDTLVLLLGSSTACCHPSTVPLPVPVSALVLLTRMLSLLRTL